jgi:hypothetical protein
MLVYIRDARLGYHAMTASPQSIGVKASGSKAWSKHRGLVKASGSSLNIQQLPRGRRSGTNEVVECRDSTSDVLPPPGTKESGDGRRVVRNPRPADGPSLAPVPFTRRGLGSRLYIMQLRFLSGLTTPIKCIMNRHDPSAGLAVAPRVNPARQSQKRDLSAPIFLPWPTVRVVRW